MRAVHKNTQHDFQRDIATAQLDRSVGENLGFLLLLVLLIMQPLHFLIHDKLLYYREMVALAFCVLFFHIFLKKRKYIFQKEEIFLVVFLFYVLTLSLFDEGVSLYGYVDLSQASQQLSFISPTIYVLRNVALYFPMLFYVSARGLSTKEMAIVCGVISLVAPISVFEFLSTRGIADDLEEIISVFQLGASGLSYNSYVPYLTFPLITSLYLFIISKHGVVKALFLSNFLFLFSYILTSTSRQSVLFSLIVIFWFLVFSDKQRKRQLAIICGIILIMGIVIWSLLAGGVIQNQRLADRFLSVEGFFNTNRFAKIEAGINLLTPEQYIWGAGVSSVIVAGPHNDYVRWIQRIGILGMILGFLPFLIALGRNWRLLLSDRSDARLLLTSCALLFLFFHSFFGYPRDDAYQSLYVFLGLALWLTVEKSRMPSSVFYRATPSHIKHGKTVGTEVSV